MVLAGAAGEGIADRRSGVGAAAFEFKAGESIRYIDFESGNDANDGHSKQTPWKHHPWDPNATGQAAACKGAHTYVFKQGVDYRGELNANESGTMADARSS